MLANARAGSSSQFFNLNTPCVPSESAQIKNLWNGVENLLNRSVYSMTISFFRCEPMKAKQLEQLISAHQRSLELFASQWTTSPEDCVQEAFLRLHRNDTTVTNHAAWLFRVVRNLAIDQGRSDSSRTNRERIVGEQRPLFSTNESNLIDGDDLQRAINQLPDEQREIIVARLWGKLTLQEISEAFGIAVSTAHRRYETGIRHLQDHFEVPCQTQRNN